MKLNLGCSNSLVSGYINVDIAETPGVVRVDLSVAPWPWADSTIEHIIAHDIIEHLANKIQTMNEIYRVLVPNGTVHIVVPTTDGPGAWQDPTHVSFWNMNSFKYYYHGSEEQRRFAKAYNITAMFRAISSTLHPDQGDGPRAELTLVAVK